MEDPEICLQQHCVSSPSASVTDTSYCDTSEDEGVGWISSFARSIKDTIPVAIDGIAHTARSFMNELAEMEDEVRRARADSCDDSEARSIEDAPSLPFPWEICFQRKDEKNDISITQKEDETLKDRVFALSRNEDAFTGPFNGTQAEIDDSFILDDSRVMLIRRLLQEDSHLGVVHAKVSGRSEMKETVFWKNYFFHCEKLRDERENEINEENITRSSHDDELDAELVGRPPVSCTGFYPRTGKLAEQESSILSNNDEQLATAIPLGKKVDSFVIVDEEDTDLR